MLRGYHTVCGQSCRRLNRRLHPFLYIALWPAPTQRGAFPRFLLRKRDRPTRNRMPVTHHNVRIDDLVNNTPPPSPLIYGAYRMRLARWEAEHALHVAVST